MRSVFTSSLCALWLAACNGSGVSYLGPVTDQPNVEDTSPQTDLRSCDERDIAGECTDYLGAGWNASNIAGECRGTLVSSCPTSDLGGCRFSPGQPVERVLWYYDGVYYSEANVELLELGCTNGFGQWLP